MSSGAINQEDLGSAITRIPVEDAIRIFPSKFLSTPLGTGQADNRFALISSPYTVLFLAEDFETAFLEVVVRDRYTGTSGARELPRKVRSLHAYSPVATVPDSSLSFLDLRGDGCHRVRVPTNTVRGSDHDPGRALGGRIFAHHRDLLDGILFHSRHNDRCVYAVFSWAITRLVAGNDGGSISAHPDLERTMRAHNIAWRA